MQLNRVPRSSRLTVQFSGNYAVELTYRLILPNLVDNSYGYAWDFSQPETEKSDLE